MGLSLRYRMCHAETEKLYNILHSYSNKQKKEIDFFSVTGQPIAVQPPRPQMSHLNKKPVLQQPPTEDEIRKWTEKKRRSKSLPRGGSEIDEILGNLS